MWIEVFNFLSFKIQEVPGCVARFLHAGNIPPPACSRAPLYLSSTMALTLWLYMPATTIRLWAPYWGVPSAQFQPRPNGRNIFLGLSCDLSFNSQISVQHFYLLPWKSQSLKVGGPSGRFWNMLSGSQSKCDYWSLVKKAGLQHLMGSEIRGIERAAQIFCKEWTLVLVIQRAS